MVNCYLILGGTFRHCTRRVGSRVAADTCLIAADLPTCAFLQDRKKRLGACAVPYLATHIMFDFGSLLLNSWHVFRVPCVNGEVMSCTKQATRRRLPRQRQRHARRSAALKMQICKKMLENNQNDDLRTSPYVKTCNNSPRMQPS